VCNHALTSREREGTARGGAKSIVDAIDKR
jgi:hypothetical protein